MGKFFKVLYQSKKSKARLGEITTTHGVIKTPTFVAVGTKGTVKGLTPDLLKQIGIQVAFVNTYHLVTHPGADLIYQAGGIHNYGKLNMPLMSDSGGFQVFSLAKSKNQLVINETLVKDNKVRRRNFLTQLRLLHPKSARNLSSSSLKSSKKVDIRGEEQPILVKITDDGVIFRSIFDGSLIEFTPEKSMEYQMKIGTDINMAFDECIYYGCSYDYALKATERTHRWLKRCMDYKVRQHVFLSTSPSLKAGNRLPSHRLQKQLPSLKQYLYGVIQGGVFEDLRKKSAEFVVSQKTDGVAIGGVSVGETKKEMREQVKWVADYLPKDRPVHLLGVGQIDDILDLVKYGIDTFDCVEPTRLARMGTIYQLKIKNLKLKLNKFVPSIEEIDINKSVYKYNLEPVDISCDCYVCKNFTKSYLHHLFKQKELLAYTLATYHNLYVMEKIFQLIRKMIEKDLI